MVKVLVADDHPLFRTALTDILNDLEEELEVVAVGAFDQLQEVLDDDLDLILLDLMMPQVQGFSALIFIRGQTPSVPVVVVSAKEDVETMRLAKQYGAAGFLPKSASAEILHRGIKTVLNGGAFWEMEQSAQSASVEPNKNTEAFDTLTKSEMKVLRLMSAGDANKVIAYKLDVKESTVKSHITSILRKLNVYSRTQAVVLASQTLDPDDLTPNA